MEQVVNDKVETFWKGIENGPIRRGQVSHNSPTHEQNNTVE